MSLKPILTGEQDELRRSIVVFDEYGPCRMIRTAVDKLVLRYPDGPNEYYDLVNDPGENVNLFTEPRFGARIAELSSQLGDWFDQYVDPRFDGSREAVRGCGQLTSHAFV